MKKVLQVFLVIDLLILNIVVGYVAYLNFFSKSSEQVSAPVKSDSLADKIVTNDACPASCVDLIDQTKFSESIETVASPTPTVIPTKAPVYTSAKQKIKYTSYVPIPGSGSTLNTSWTTLEGTDFYLTTADYPGLVGVYFEANIKLQNGNGVAYVRIYDVTNSRAVDGSDVSTSSQTTDYVSNGPLSLWAGYNHYAVQARSLTADTTHFVSGRLKIVTEN
jgi:hypothetical protein